MIWLFLGLALLFLFLFCLALYHSHCLELMNAKQADRISELVSLAAYWQKRAKEAEDKLRYGPDSP